MSRFIGIARQMKDRAITESNKAVDGLELMFGEVTPKGIVTNRFKGKPIEDYHIFHPFAFGEYMAMTSVDGEHPHSHKVVTPEQLYKLKDGDLVVMAIVDGEFVVLGRLVKKNGK